MKISLSKDKVMEMNPDIITLYRYFAYAAHMRDLFRREISADWLKMLSADKSGLVLFFYSAPGIYFLYSYSGIYLVIEGWRDLNLSDPKIDELLNSPFVERLRLFRNATFHYQREPMSWKHLQFFGTGEEQTEKWLNELYSELERFFLENTLPLPSGFKESFKDKSHFQIAQAIKDYWASEMRADGETNAKQDSTPQGQV
ncbi:MAG: hypothetical protein HYX72_03385 [Acidobacteria bacterium]|nr:hypothetical protein [Acidobacteriota bacterium]